MGSDNEKIIDHFALHFEFRMLLRNDNTITINANWFLNIIENLMNGATSEPAAF